MGRNSFANALGRSILQGNRRRSRHHGRSNPIGSLIGGFLISILLIVFGVMSWPVLHIFGLTAGLIGAGVVILLICILAIVLMLRALRGGPEILVPNAPATEVIPTPDGMPTVS